MVPAMGSVPRTVRVRVPITGLDLVLAMGQGLADPTALVSADRPQARSALTRRSITPLSRIPVTVFGRGTPPDLRRNPE